MTHDRLTAASPWILRFADHVRPGGQVLDLASGAGRHARLFLERGSRVLAIDRDVSGLADIRDHPRLELLEADLERDRACPFAGRRFDAVVVVNYLHRPLLSELVSAVAPGGLLLYETFTAGHERFGRPRNPDYLLTPSELLDAVCGRLRVLAYEDVEVDEPRPAAVQRIAARREDPTDRTDSGASADDEAR